MSNNIFFYIFHESTPFYHIYLESTVDFKQTNYFSKWNMNKCYAFERCTVENFVLQKSFF